MPGRNYGRSSRKMRMLTVNSEKHVVDATIATTSTNVVSIIAKAVTAPSNTVDTDCHRGGIIKAIWISLDFCGLGTTLINRITSVYLMKNPGANLTPPGVFAVGTSNEKKFVIKQWSQMTMLNSDGNPPYHWEGWIKIPKRYQRMGTDDTWVMVYGVSAQTGHGYHNAIYKEYF